MEYKRSGSGPKARNILDLKIYYASLEARCMSDGEDDSRAVDGDRPSSLSELADQLSSRADGAVASDEQSLSELAETVGNRRSDDPVKAEANEWDVVDDDRANGVADPKTEALLELVADSANVLLSGTSGILAEQRLCAHLMEPHSSNTADLLVVTITERPSERLSILRNYLDGSIGEIAVVDVRTYNLEERYEQYGDSTDITTVSSAQDLRRIGIVISKILTRWDEHSSETTMCFHSLSDLLSLIDDRQRVFRFLHVLRGRVQAANARAHYHIDPAEHPTEAGQTS